VQTRILSQVVIYSNSTCGGREGVGTSCLLLVTFHFLNISTLSEIEIIILNLL